MGLFKIRILCAALLMVCFTSSANAAYVLMAVESGTSNTSVTRAPGATFSIDFILTGSASDKHSYGFFNPTFSAPGLVWQSYTLIPAPILNNFSSTAPTTITAATAPGAAVDITFDYVLDYVAGDIIKDANTFGSGTIVTATFQVPAAWSGPNTVTMTIPSGPGSDTDFGLGFSPVATTVGSPFTINIPEPGSIGMLGAVATGVLFRRRRRNA